MSKVICLNCKSDMYEFYVHHLGNKVLERGYMCRNIKCRAKQIILSKKTKNGYEEKA